MVEKYTEPITIKVTKLLLDDLKKVADAPKTLSGKPPNKQVHSAKSTAGHGPAARDGYLYRYKVPAS